MLRRFLLFIALVALVLVGAAQTALAQEEIPNDAPVVEMTETITISALLVYTITTLLLPVLTGFVTKSNASALAKQLWTGLFATINAIVVAGTQLDGTAILSLPTVLLAIVSWLVATFTYLGFYEPNKLNEKLAPSGGFESFAFIK